MPPLIPSAFSKAVPELELLLDEELFEEELLDEELLEEELVEEELLEEELLELLEEVLLAPFSLLLLLPLRPQPTAVTIATESSATNNLFILHTPKDFIMLFASSIDCSLFAHDNTEPMNHIRRAKVTHIKWQHC